MGELYGEIANYYDYDTSYRERQDVGFYVEMAQQANGAVLELGSGTGRILIPIARAGKEIVGLDASPSMLNKCREKLALEPEGVRSRVRLVEGKMQNFALDQTFGLITIPFRAFLHLLTVEDQMECLQNVHRHLQEDGKFILDVFNPSIHLLAQEVDGIESEEGQRATLLPDGRSMRGASRIIARDLNHQIHDGEIIYYVARPDGTEDRHVMSFRMRYLFVYEIEHLLARCGFKIEALYADYDKTPFGEKYPGELIFVASKVR